MWGRGGVSRALSRIPACVSSGQTSPDRLKVRRCREDRRQPPGPWSLPSERASTGWRCRRRRGTSRCGTRRCGPSAPALTGPYGEWRRPGGARPRGEWRGKYRSRGLGPVWCEDRRRHVSASAVCFGPNATIKKDCKGAAVFKHQWL